MNPSPDWLLFNNLLFDAAGVAGLALLALAAARISRGTQTWGGRLITTGAVLLLIARLHVIASPGLLTPLVLDKLGWRLTAVLFTLPTMMLTVGLTAVVWGMWGYSRDLRRAV